LCDKTKNLKAFAKVGTKPGAPWFGHGYECKPCLARLHREKGWSLRNNTGVSKEQYDELLKKQGGHCALCEARPGAARRLDVDHSHETSKVRGLLCRRCNLLMAAIDKPEKLAAAAKYRDTADTGLVWKPRRLKEN
jgi:hypothetical protein